MQNVFVNHHLYQDGDTYGLIYALLLNETLSVGDLDLHGLFWINADLYRPDTKGLPKNQEEYTRKVTQRLGYFSSFGLLERRVTRVLCTFTDAVKVVNVAVEGRVVRIRANKALFNDNPRTLSLYLTASENDPGGSRRALLRGGLQSAESADEKLDRKDYLALKATIDGGAAAPGQDRVAEGLTAHFQERLRIALLRSLRDHNRHRSPVLLPPVRYEYISFSTDYVARCVREKGFAAVAYALRVDVVRSTRDYTSDNKGYLRVFLRALFAHYVEKYTNDRKRYAWVTGTPFARSGDFVVVLFWIRGAKRDELRAISKELNEDGSRPSVGKPQHHTNMTLYKLVRHGVGELAAKLGKPLLFVPIGDELTETLPDATYEKSARDHNLIRFFEREPFAGKPMGAQINFLLQLSTACQVVQVGMRSGSMERLMYLGVPTIYFDRTRAKPNLAPPVGAARIKQLCGFQGDSPRDLMEYLLRTLSALDRGGLDAKGYPLFFQIENNDTGVLKYSAEAESAVSNAVDAVLGKVSRSAYNAFKRESAKPGFLRTTDAAHVGAFLHLGGLEPKEMEKLVFMLWFTTVASVKYTSIINRRPALSPEIRLGDDPLSRDFQRFRAEKKQAEDAVRRRREEAEVARQNEPSVSLSGVFGMFDEP